MRSRRLTAVVVVLSSAATVVAGTGGALAAPARSGAAAPAAAVSRVGSGRRPSREPVPARPLTPAASGTGVRRADAAPAVVATPGRVQQLPGQAGYAFDTPATIALATTVTVPTLQCSGVPQFERNSQPGLQLSQEIGGQYVMVQSFCAPGGSPGSYQQYNYMNVLLAGIPYQPTGLLGTFPGAQIHLSETADSSGLTATIAAPGQGFSQSFNVPGSWTGSAFVGTLDYLENANGGVPAYNPVTFASTTLNGSSLGSYLSGSPAPNFSHQNSVFGATLQDQSSDIATGDTFSITNANATLPTVLVSTATPGVERPSSVNATITFTVALSFPSSSPVYLDYNTQDDTAFAGSDYTATSGTLAFAPGTTSQTVPVTVLPGPESGGELDFLLAISNPSFAYNPPGSGGVGRIYAGPMVLAVTPDVVPLKGGGSVTLNGVFFGPAGSADTVQLCASGCVTAGSRTVVSDTTIKLAVPDLSGIDPSGSAPFTADAVVTDTHSVTSPITSSDKVHVGCQAVTDQPVGAWAYSGCVNQVDSTDAVTNQTSQLDGMEVSASTHDRVDYSTGGAAGVAVTSSGSSTVSLNVAGNLVAIFRGVLSKSLPGPVTFTVPAGTQIAGVKLAGTLTITPVAGQVGQATGVASATLPALFGSSTGTLSFTTAVNGGVSNLVLVIPHASFGDLLSLSGVTLTFSPTTGWSITGTTTIGGGSNTAPLTGTATFANNTLTAGHLSAFNLDVFGLLKVSTFELDYTAGAWTGSGTLVPEDGGNNLSLSLAVDATGKITSGSITIGSGVNLFGGPLLSLLSLSYASGTWTLSGQTTINGGLLTGKLTVLDGVLQTAEVKLKKVPVIDGLSIEKASLKYALVGGEKDFTGELVFRVPLQNGLLQGIGGNFSTVNGQFASAGITVLGNFAVPFIAGVFITKFNATIGWIPPPAQLVGGAVTLSLGPQLPAGGSIMSLDGDFTRNARPIPFVSDYTFNGAVKVLGQQLGKAVMVLPDNGTDSITITLGDENTGILSLGPIALQGSITGTFGNNKFNIDGKVAIALSGGRPFTATVHADGTGMAACQGTQRGFAWIWGQTPTLQPTGQCTTTGF